MKVKAIHALQGPKETVPPGTVLEMDPSEAQGLLAIGAVELVEVPEPSKPEAVKAKPGKQP